jgi:hypothetical protein
VSRELELGKRGSGTVGRGAEGQDGVVASVHDFAGVALQEDFTDKFGPRIGCIGRVGEVPGRVEGFGQCEMLFCYDST